MHPALAEMLKRYITQVYPLDNPGEWLFIDGFEGRRLYPTKIYDCFRDLLLKAGIKHGGRGKGPRREWIWLVYVIFWGMLTLALLIFMQKQMWKKNEKHLKKQKT